MRGKPMLLFVVTVLTASLSLAGCLSKTQDELAGGRAEVLAPITNTPPPELLAYTDHASFPVQHISYDYGGSVYSSSVNVIQEDRDPREYLHFVYIGETIYLELDSDQAIEEAYITDQIYTSKGYPKYNERVGMNIPIEFDDGKAQFVVPENLAVMLSSDSKDYEPGANIRGFELYVDWGGGSCSYFFAFRSDTAMPEGPKEEKRTETEWIYPVESDSHRGLSVIWYDDAFDFPADETAQIVLYANADMDSSGEFIYSDENEWELNLKTVSGRFLLLPKQTINRGDVDIISYRSGSGELYHIMVTVSSSAGIETWDFTYDEEMGAFAKIPLSSYQNIDVIGTSR